MESGAEDRLIAVLAGASGPLSLAQAAERIGLSPPATHRQLQGLVKRGFARRIVTNKAVTYSLSSAVEISLLVPPANGIPGFAHRWFREGHFDWRYPLASRLPDERGRTALSLFLREVEARGWFSPWLLSYVDTSMNSHNHVWANLSSFERNERMADRTNHGAVHVYAYGSCVTGAAHQDSDLDLLVIHEMTQANIPRFPYEAAIVDLVKKLNLSAPRRLDVRTYGEDEFFDGLTNLHARARDSILQTAITVYSTSSTPRFLETRKTSIEEALDAWMNTRA